MATIITPINNTSNGPTNLHTTAQNYYDRVLLENMEQKLVMYNHAVKRHLPLHNGKTVEFWRYNVMDPITDPLQEGVVPAAQTYTQSKLTATIEAYGGWAAYTDMLDFTAIDDQKLGIVKLLGDQAAISVDTLIRDKVLTGTNVLYSGAVVGRSSLTAENILSVKDIRRAVRVLDKKGAHKFYRNGRGYYKAVIGADAKYALMNDKDWKDMATYQQAEKIEQGELGKLYGVIFFETTNNKIFEGAGSGSADVDTVLVYGDDAYGVVGLGEAGDNVHMIMKPKGSAGTADPLDQAGTVGWKVDGMTTVILNQDWIVRIESAVAAA